MKLIDILKRNFILTLLITTIIILIISVITISIYSKVIYNEKIINFIKILYDKETQPIIQTTQEIIYSKFQIIIKSLTSIYKMYEIYEKEINQINNINDLKIKIGENSIILKNLINIIKLNENFDNILKSKKNLNDYSTWFVDKDFKNFDDNIDFSDKKEKRILLYIFTKLIPLLKTHFEMFKERPEFQIKLLYLTNQKNELIFFYPLLNNSKFYKQFDNFQNPSFCKNHKNEIPNYYYFWCSEVFLQIAKTFESNNFNFKITYPYLLANEGVYGITICLYFDSNLTNMNYEDHLNNKIIICADLIISDLLKYFDTVNQNLNGYFYLMPVNDIYPLYYPFQTYKYYYPDLTRLEFDITHKHYINEISNFKHNILPNLIGKYEKNQNIFQMNLDDSRLLNLAENNFLYRVTCTNYSSSSCNFYYLKNKHNYTFSIFPIFFNDYINDKEINLLNLIFTQDMDYIKDLKIIYNSRFWCLITVLFFVFSLIGLILLTFVGQLIIIFGKNVTNAVNYLTKKIKVDTDSKYIYDNNNNLLTNNELLVNIDLCNGLVKKNNVNEKEEIEKLIKLINKNKENKKFNFNDEEEINLCDKNNENNYNEDDEENEENINIKNQEITNKFDLILNLKKVFLFLQNPQSTFQKHLIIKFLSSNEIFNEIKNMLGNQICLSNLGNLNNLNKKYDKAIIFLSKSLNLSDKEYLIDENKLKIIEEYFKIEKEEEKIEYNLTYNFNVDFERKLKNNNNKENENDFEKNNFFNKIENNQIINNVEFLRYVKLFYAYYRFFSNIKNIEKILQEILTTTNNSNIYNSIKQYFSFYYDYYLNNSIHNLSKYKQTILLCLFKLINSKYFYKQKEKICYCLLELFKFEINYLKILIKRNINEKNFIFNNKNIYKNFDDEDSDSNNNNKNIIYNKDKKIKKQLNITIKIEQTLHEFLEKIKKSSIKKNENKEYYNFLYELKKYKKKPNNFNLNYFTLNQEYNYLFAKFSKLCGDYSKAITFYLKTIDDNLLVSNAILFKKANEKIINIINYAKENNELLSIKFNDINVVNNLYEKCKFNIDNFVSKFKDVFFILDQSKISFDEKNNIHFNQIKIIKKIFEKFLSSEDKFSLFIFNDNKNKIINEKNILKNNICKKIIPLMFKNSENYSFIVSILNELKDNIFHDFNNNENNNSENDNKNENILNNENNNLNKLENYIFNEQNSENNYNNLKIKFSIEAIFNVLNEINQNENEKNREKYVILLTEAFQPKFNNNINEEIIKNLFNNYSNKSINFVKKIIIIGSMLKNQNIFYMLKKEFNFYNINIEYLEFENYQEIKKLMNIMSLFPRDYEYPNENFDI